MTLPIILGLVTLVAMAWLTWPLLRGVRGGEGRGAYDRRIYRDQLAEIDRDRARGVLDETEAGAARAEVARRLLSADAEAGREARPAAAPRGVTRAVAAVVIVLGAGGAAGLYLAQGAPGLPDQPFAARVAAARPTQEAAEAMLREAGIPAMPEPGAGDQEYVGLLRQLRTALETRPGDLRGHRFLAGTLARLRGFAEARIVQEKVIALAGDAVTARDWADLAEYRILATNGYVSPEAELALTEALNRDPTLGPARYYAGLLMIQNGEPKLGFDLWSTLLAEGPEDAPWIAPIRAQIGAVAASIGASPPTGPAGGPATPPGEAALGPRVGPSADEVTAAQDMTPEARQTMIRGMVDGLATRLAGEGGTPDEWARLIRALGVLGERDRARAIWGEAQQVFAATPGAVAEIRAAAVDAGVAQ